MNITALKMLVFLTAMSLGSKWCTANTSTPPLPNSVTQTLATHQSESLNPTSTYSFPSSSVYISAKAGCGGNLTNSSGQLAHPEYPKPLAKPAACTWRILLDPGRRVSLLYNYVNLKGGCDKNFIEVWNLPLTGPRSLIKRLCGYVDKPERLVTEGHNVEVSFQSNSSSEGGFLLSYETFKGCNQTFTNTSGEIVSPYYPDNYPLNIYCTYTITVPADHQVSLAIEFLDLAYSLNCTENVLEVWEGSIGKSAPIGRYCGYLFSQWAHSKGNKLSLSFRSDMASTRRGYKLKYYAVKSDCNTTVNVTQGHLATYNQLQGPCSWKISTVPSHMISIQFDRFYLRLSKNCSLDYLLIKDDQSEIGQYCGYRKGELVYSNTNSVTLVYSSSIIDKQYGFQIYYEAIPKPDTYKYLNRTRGYLQSPLYPSSYPSNTKYAWFIELLPGYNIDIIFDDFELEFTVNCTNDFIEIFDGGDNSSASLGKYCGAKKPTDHVKSSGNLMYVEFSSNSERTTNGFQISYNAIKADSCPKNFTNPTGTIISPNYPDFYPKDYNCEWHIVYNEGYQIYLTLVYFDLVSTDKCNGDHVIFKGVTGEQDDQKYCGYVVRKHPLVSKLNTMVIKFYTDSLKASRGFVLNYMVDGTGFPPSPRTPLSNELDQAVQIELYNITKKEWITNKDIAFKKLIANVTTVFCSNENMQRCHLAESDKERQRRSLNPAKFTMASIHLAPGYPKDAGPVLVLVLYALYPNHMKVDPSWRSPALSQDALKDAIINSKVFIEISFRASIKSVTPYSSFIANTSSLPPVKPKLLQNVLPFVLGCIGAFTVFFVVVFVACLKWRKKNHGKFMVKRCVTPIEFVDKNDELPLEKVKSGEKKSPRRRISTLKVVDIEDEQ